MKRKIVFVVVFLFFTAAPVWAAVPTNFGQQPDYRPDAQKTFEAKRDKDLEGLNWSEQSPRTGGGDCGGTAVIVTSLALTAYGLGQRRRR